MVQMFFIRINHNAHFFASILCLATLRNRLFSICWAELMWVAWVGCRWLNRTDEQSHNTSIQYNWWWSTILYFPVHETVILWFYICSWWWIYSLRTIFTILLLMWNNILHYWETDCWTMSGNDRLLCVNQMISDVNNNRFPYYHIMWRRKWP